VKRLLKNILLIFNILAAVALTGAIVSQYVPPDRWWSVSLLGLLFPYLAALNLLLLVVWLIVKPVYMVIPGAVLLAGWGMLGRFIQLTGRESESVDYTLVSYNVKNFSGSGSNPSHELAEGIKGFLRQNEPDFICLQEVKLRTNTVFNIEETKKTFHHIKHYQYARSGKTMGSVTMSRLPISRMEEIRFENSGNIAIATDFVDGRDTIRVFNIHLQSYRIDPDRYDIIDSPGIPDKKNMKEFRELIRKYKRAMEMRAMQARLIRRKIDQSPHPVIVCGDFNDTPSSYAYRKTRGPLRDGFIRSGKGIGQTYVGKLPSFRIDYILFSRDFEGYNFRIHDFISSDHLPVSCGLKRRAR